MGGAEGVGGRCREGGGGRESNCLTHNNLVSSPPV